MNMGKPKQKHADLNTFEHTIHSLFFSAVVIAWRMTMKHEISVLLPWKQQTFTYKSSLWTSDDSYNVDGGWTRFDDMETKLSTYSTLKINRLCLVFRRPDHDELGYVLIHRQTSQTLRSLIHDGTYRPTSVENPPGYQPWRTPRCSRTATKKVSTSSRESGVPGRESASFPTTRLTATLQIRHLGLVLPGLVAMRISLTKSQQETSTTCHALKAKTLSNIHLSTSLVYKRRSLAFRWKHPTLLVSFSALIFFLQSSGTLYFSRYGYILRCVRCMLPRCCHLPVSWRKIFV